MELYGTPKVGGDILAYCGKCKIELSHVIMAMVSGRPVKVQCNTCKSPHNYRLGGSAPKRPRTGLKPERSTAPRKSTMRNADYWEEKMIANKALKSRAYKPTEVFKKGELIDHVQFGVGLVEEVKPGAKILVLFRDAEKTLVHSMGVQA